MCLQKVTKTYIPFDGKIHKGWKEVASGNHKTFNFLFYPAAKALQYDKWYKIPYSRVLNAGDGRTYPSGFHIYRKKRFKRWGRVPVYYAGIIAMGYEGVEEEVIVAKYIYFPQTTKHTPQALHAAAYALYNTACKPITIR